ncbi:MAG: hypothetical protein HOP08_04705 [Cyclobacteriaceae bacterium]|nr:hypothetical protein [Cyclobacteriaceae bacterium]
MEKEPASDFVFEIEKRPSYIFIKAKGVRKNLISISESTHQVLQLMEEFHCDYILGDYRETSTPISTTDAFNLSRLYEVDDATFRRLNIAMVVSSKEEPLYHSWEEFCIRRGFNYRIFLDIKEAEKWLLGLMK